MAVDIKDAGILAGFELWGWPWHGLCTSGVIDLPGSLTKTITAPAHGSAWLIDRGLPAIERTAEQLVIDAALGHEWRNYGMVSGGVVYGTQLGENKYIHVDEAGERWLISMAYSYPEVTLNKVRITFSIVQFGLFGEGVKTPITVVKDVQCSFITYTEYGYAYNSWTTELEDVWTNGSKALVGVYRTRNSLPLLKDMFSLLEVVITGTGGATGSGLVVDVTEIMPDTSLSYGGYPESIPIQGLVDAGDPFAWSGDGYVFTPSWVNSNVYGGHYSATSTGIIPLNGTDLLEYYYARFAYYNSAGEAKAARIKKVKNFKRTFVGAGGWTSHGTVDGSGGTGWISDAYLFMYSQWKDEHEFGIFLLENDTIIDELSVYQDNNYTENYALVGWPVDEPIAEDRSPIVVCPTTSCNTEYTALVGWGTSGGGLFWEDVAAATTGGPIYKGSLAASLSLPPPKDLRDPGGWYYDDDIDPVPIEPLDIDDLLLRWREPSEPYGGAQVIAGTASLGIMRFKSKAAAFYKNSDPYVFAQALTPVGMKTVTVSVSGTSDVYFSWQRKTLDSSFSLSPICYV